MAWDVRRASVIAFVPLLASACTSTSDVFPLNEAAKKIGDPKIQFERNGTGQGPVTITMPSGEILTGNYHIDRNAVYGSAFGTGGSAGFVGVGNGSVQFVAKGPTTEILCRGSVSLGGHGAGQCQTVDGAMWTVSY